MPIERIMVPKWGRTPDITTREAILFILDTLGPTNVTGIFHNLGINFVPSFGTISMENVQWEVHKLITDGTVTFGHDGLVRRK